MVTPGPGSSATPALDLLDASGDDPFEGIVRWVDGSLRPGWPRYWLSGLP
jgi:hypothetical protein